MNSRIFEMFRDDGKEFAKLVGQQNLIGDLRNGIEQATTVDELFVAYDKFYEDVVSISRVVARMIPIAMYLKDEDTCQEIIQIMDSIGLENELPNLISEFIAKEEQLNSSL